MDELKPVAIVTTRARRRLSIRPVSRGDSELLRQFFRKVTSADLRFRFLAEIDEVPSAHIAAMVDVDFKGAEDLLAFLEDGSLAATAMIALDPEGSPAEVAIVVRSDLKGQGIGRAMLDYATDFAKAHGATSIEAVEDRGNQPAIAVERDSGFASRCHDRDPSLVIMTKQLAS